MNPSDNELRALLEKVRTIAIVGAKDVPGQPVDNVGRYLISKGYTVYPVHPKRKNIWGLHTYAAIADLPPVDLIDVFRAPEYCPGHAREALSLSERPLLFWMQLGISSPEAAAALERENVHVVQNACLMVEHRRLFGAS